MSFRLSTDSLPRITSAEKPAYDRGRVSCGIVHLGIGAFHRAHQAVYTDDLLASGDTRWGIAGVSLRTSAVCNTLVPQDCLYTVQTLGAERRPRIIGSLLTAFALSEAGHLAQVLDVLAHPGTQVVSLTITEKGYCADHRGELDAAHPDIAHDLTNQQAPRSAPGLLALGLSRRMQTGAGALTILSCDNLAGNGQVTSSVVVEMARRLNPELAHWIADAVSFPASMVDRIVPQTGETELAVFEAVAGYRDLALTRGEPFSQWVVENQFAGARPAWDMAGAQFVNDVAPFEQAKLQLLNATHSALAYLGLLAGYTYVHQAIADPVLHRFVGRLLDNEITPEVVCPSGMNLTDYKASILNRFANALVPYKTLQVASDGSLKLPQRIFPTIEARLASQRPVKELCLVVAAWIHCLTGTTVGTTKISVSDPAREELAALAAQYSKASDLIRAIATETSHFATLGNHPLFLDALSQSLAKLQRAGSPAATER